MTKSWWEFGIDSLLKGSVPAICIKLIGKLQKIAVEQQFQK